MAIRIGAVIQIGTKNGFAYAQYTHEKPKYGEIIRVMAGFYEQPQTDLDRLVNKTTAFFTLFPLRTAVRMKAVEVIGNRPVPEFAQTFPIFKLANMNPETKKYVVWGLWDGEKEWKITQLKEEEKNYPVIEILSSNDLIARLERGWTPREDLD